MIEKYYAAVVNGRSFFGKTVEEAQETAARNLPPGTYECTVYVFGAHRRAAEIRSTVLTVDEPEPPCPNGSHDWWPLHFIPPTDGNETIIMKCTLCGKYLVRRNGRVTYHHDLHISTGEHSCINSIVLIPPRK